MGRWQRYQGVSSERKRRIIEAVKKLNNFAKARTLLAMDPQQIKAYFSGSFSDFVENHSDIAYYYVMIHRRTDITRELAIALLKSQDKYETIEDWRRCKDLRMRFNLNLSCGVRDNRNGTAKYLGERCYPIVGGLRPATRLSSHFY